MHFSWKSPFRLAKEALRAGLAKLLGSEVVVDHPTCMARIATCEFCPHFSNRQCTKCTCFMDIKAWIGTASCPDGRWQATITIRKLLKAKFRWIPWL